MTIDEFINECSKLNVKINEDKKNKLILYKDLLIEWNKKFNLTTIIEEKDIYLKHFYDSLCINKVVKLSHQKICDFGTGAGFPGMILAICFQNLDVTLLESNHKKIIFLEVVKKELNLKNVTIICKRVEDYGKENRNIFDIITCRAVSNLNIILELSTSLLKINGFFIPMKSSIEEELKNASKNIDKLSYKLLNKIEYTLPIENSKRTVLLFMKYKETDLKYPRNYNIIKKQNFK